MRRWLSCLHDAMLTNLLLCHRHVVFSSGWQLVSELDNCGDFYNNDCFRESDMILDAFIAPPDQLAPRWTC